MRKFTLICIFALISGCEKQPEQTNQPATTQFEKADQKISDFLDLLDDTNADRVKQKDVLCTEYPKVYEHEYMPALMQLTQGETKESLLQDLKISTDFYKEKLEIVCD
ncbi:hypothetical protein GPS47_11545 [Acinetobacter haemolyticus]|uniref:hypothetical protein n=1 Tax=Acinetobacter haemolyticus TaxID=29430 RepID=UPI001372EE5C|nr:hypothetical protein [Acinetobacter haemolyticus]NAS06218.1 hypothetical protein [Acinetobacter haemolyticus]